jgi:outer membrane protein, heavy metal efflux system
MTAVCRRARTGFRRWSAVVFLAALCLFGGTRSACAQTPPASSQTSRANETLTIEQAVQEATDHNRDLAAKRRDVAVASTQMVTAQLRPNPVLSLAADHLDWLGTGFNETNNGGPTEYAVRVDVPVERGSKRDLRMDQAGSARALAESQVDDAIRTLRLTVELACVDVIQATENLALTRDTLRTFQDLAALNDNRVRAGAAPPSEATRTRVAMLQFQANVSRAELALRAASMQLRHLLGRTASSDPLTVVEPPVRPPAAPGLQVDNLQALATDHRPDLVAAKQTEAHSVADLRLQLAVGKVDFTYGAEYRRQQGPENFSNSIGVFFSAPIPIASRNQGEIARAMAERDQHHLELSAVEEGIRSDVAGALDAYEATGALVASIERDLIAPAQSARDIAEYTYRAHATTLVELIDSQRAWNDAMQTYHDAQADYWRAVARLNAAVGVEVVR